MRAAPEIQRQSLTVCPGDYCEVAGGGGGGGEWGLLRSLSLSYSEVVLHLVCDQHLHDRQVSLDFLRSVFPGDLAGTLTGVQGDIRCKVLAALSTAKYKLEELA